MPFEQIPMPLPEKPKEKSLEENNKENIIEVTQGVGGRKRSSEEIEKYKRIREEITKEKEIRERLERGELISQEEAAFLREKEMLRRSKEEKREEEEPKAEAKEEEKTNEKILAEKREIFAKSEIEKKEILEMIKKAKAEKLVNEIKLEDWETINNLKEKKNLSPGEEKALKEVIERKMALIKYLELKDPNSKNRGEEVYEKVVEHKKIKEEYLKSLAKYRADLYEKTLQEIEKLGLSEKEADKLMRQRMEEIIKTTVVSEANNLYELRTKIKLEAKKDASFLEKAWKAAGKSAEWYRKLPLKYKLAMSAGLFAGGIGAGAIGGVAGLSLATGVIGGRWFQRIFGGAATVVAVEGFMKHFQEKRLEKKTIKNFADKLSEKIKNNDKELDKKLFELIGKKKKQKITRYIVAGTAGVVVGTGLLGKVINWGSEKIGIGKSIREAVEKIGISKPKISPDLTKVLSMPDYEPPLGEEMSAYEPSVAPGEEMPAYEAVKGGPQIAQKGDSVWKIIGRQLEERYDEKFARLDEARKTYIIDALKDKVAANPEKFDLTDIDKIKAGKSYDFLPSSKMEIDRIFEEAGNLKRNQLESILENNEKIENWLKAHPGEKLTTGKIDEILYGKKLPLTEGFIYEAPSGEGFLEEEVNEEKLAREEFAEEKLSGQEIAEDEFPGEEVPTETVETMPEEKKWSLETEKQIEEAMKYNEMTHIKTIGFTEGEYEAIKNFKIGRLLELIPSREEAWNNCSLDEFLKIKKEIPHDGFYGTREFYKHIKLAELIRSYHPGNWVKEMTVKEFLQRFGPKEIL